MRDLIAKVCFDKKEKGCMPCSTPQNVFEISMKLSPRVLEDPFPEIQGHKCISKAKEAK